jgi:hypothetical protein
MIEKPDLKTMKTKVHRTILEDGLLEIMLGIYFVLSGLYLKDKSLVINYFWLPVALVLIDVLRRRYVYPRTGFARLKMKASEIIRVFLAIILGVGLIAALIALVAAGFGEPIKGKWRDILTIALILFTTIFFCFIAYRFDVPRWYLHGILIGSVILLNQFVKIPMLVIALGGLIIAIGMWVFIDFLNKYPVQTDQSLNYPTHPNGK